MKKFFLFAAVGFLAATSGEAAAKLRIVSLKPAITDTIVAMGHSEMLVGVTKYCSVSESSTRPDIVGDYTRPYVEKIISLKPDIVLGSKENSSRKSVKNLEKFGLRVELLSFDSQSEILESVKKIGEFMGRPDDGTRLAAKMKNALIEMESRWSKHTPKRLFIVWGRRPLVVAGGASFIEEYLPAIGAINVMSASKIPYPRIGLEEMIAADPEVIIDLSMGNENDRHGGKVWERVPEIAAVKNKRVYTLKTEDFRPGPRLLDGLDRLAKLIHGD
jgi:ABC-type Fe3+-hydroxamate transport system substrate-binding protein